MFGMNPGVFHVISLVLHIANSLLLFSVLNRMTGEFWKSAFVGTLFALHPINVESVAWVAELNNVISGLFFMLTLLAYKFYTEKATWKRYVPALIVFELGLLAKPVIITLPFILFLLDLWPLKRIQVKREENKEGSWLVRIMGVPVPLLILEKIPFLALSLISLASNLIGANKRMGLYSSEIVPMGLRISHAIVSPLKYLEKLFWPHEMVVFYPYSSMIPWWQVIGAAFILIIVTALVLRAVFKYPKYLVGWLWFLGGLVPFLGIIQAGIWCEMQDRYAYITCIGIFIIISWGIPDMLIRYRHYRSFVTIASAGVICMLIVLSYNQVGYWKDSFTLFKHTLALIENKPEDYSKNTVAMAYNNFGLALFHQGSIQEAIKAYQQSIRFNPNIAQGHFNLGRALAEQKVYEEAIDEYRKCLVINPEDAESYNNLGNIMKEKGNFDEAIKYYTEALRIDPNQEKASYNLGNIYLNKGNIQKAIEYYEQAVRNKPSNIEAMKNLRIARLHQDKLNDLIIKMKSMLEDDPRNYSLHIKLGDIYRQLGATNEAVNQYQKAFSIQPKSNQALFGLVMVYSDCQDYTKTLAVLQKMIQIQPDNPEVFYNVACVYAKQNMKEQSIAWLKQSIEKGFHNWDMIKHDPDLSNIRNTSFIKELISNHPTLLK